MLRSVLLLCTLAFVAACEPVLVFPGGELAGAEAPAPRDWSFSDDIETIQFETRPGDPYSVNIWVIALGSVLYVHAGANRAAWVEHIESDPSVRIRIGKEIYPLTAARVTDAAEFARFSDAYEKKYDRRPRNENVAEAYLFQLTSRADPG